MARIKQEDLVHLTNEVIRDILDPDLNAELPTFIKNYIENQGSSYDGNIWTRSNRITNLLTNIVIKRFINKEL